VNPLRGGREHDAAHTGRKLPRCALSAETHPVTAVTALFPTVQNCHGPGPAGGGGPHLHREAGHTEAVRRQRLQIVQLLQVAIADLPTGPVSLPDQSGIPGLPMPFRRVHEGGIPAPSIRACQFHSGLQQVQRGFATHSAAGIDVIILAIAAASARVDHYNLQRLQLMADTPEFGVHVAGGDDVSVGKVAEVQFYAGLEASLQRHLIDRDRTFAVVHGGREMIRRIEVGAVMSGHLHGFNGPPLSIGQFLSGQSRENAEQLRHRRLVINVRNLGAIERRIGGNRVL